jgi:carboxyl-terminal processing protease
VAKYFTPRHRSIQDQGIAPDVVAEGDPAAGPPAPPPAGTPAGHPAPAPRASAGPDAPLDRAIGVVRSRP